MQIYKENTGYCIIENAYFNQCYIELKPHFWLNQFLSDVI